MKIKIARLAKFFTQGGLRGHFGQYGEDTFLRKHFRQRTGFYIDVGAHHPFQLSNTAGLWLSGWNGVNIDASETAIRLFQKVRPLDTNIYAAVVPTAMSKSQEKITLYSSREIDNCATCDPQLALARGLTEKVSVPTISLKNVMDKLALQGLQKVDFLNIDIEGLDEAVLSDLAEWRFRPGVIMMEIYGESIRDVLNSKAVDLLESENYAFVQKIGHTCVFVADSEGQ